MPRRPRALAATGALSRHPLCQERNCRLGRSVVGGLIVGEMITIQSARMVPQADEIERMLCARIHNKLLCRPGAVSKRHHGSAFPGGTPVVRFADQNQRRYFDDRAVRPAIRIVQDGSGKRCVARSFRAGAGSRDAQAEWPPGRNPTAPCAWGSQTSGSPSTRGRRRHRTSGRLPRCPRCTVQERLVGQSCLPQGPGNHAR